jgi:hypothetical protein
MKSDHPHLSPAQPGWDFAACAALFLVGAAPEMEEDVFWDLAEEIGWSRNLDLERAGLALFKRLPLTDSVGAANRARSLSRVLQERLEAWENESGKKIPLGDDRFMDLVNHIVGLGQTMYHRVMRDPTLALKRAERADFRESFLHVFSSAEKEYAIQDLFEALRILGDVRTFEPGAELSDYDLVEHEQYGLGIALVRETGSRIVFQDGDLLD